MNDNLKTMAENVKNNILKLFEELMQEERKEYMDKKPGSKGNGYYERDLITTFGNLENLKVPRVRDSKFQPEILPYRKKVSYELEDVIFAMFSSGSSTRDVARFIENLYGAKYSASAVSRLTNIAQKNINEFKKRPLEEEYSVVYFDATFISLRREYVAKEPVYIFIGVRNSGEREVLGYYMFGSEGESASSWLIALRDLKKRGVKRVGLFVTDDLSGIRTSIMKVFPSSNHQLCVLHAMRETNSLVRAKHKAEVSSDLKEIYTADSVSDAKIKLTEFEKIWNNVYPKVVMKWKRNFYGYTTFMHYDKKVRRFIYTTNLIERLNKEIKRRTKVIEVFSTEASLEKILYIVLKERNSYFLNRKMANFSSVDFFKKTVQKKAYA